MSRRSYLLPDRTVQRVSWLLGNARLTVGASSRLRADQRHVGFMVSQALGPRQGTCSGDVP
jgi:hypothetical protein